VLDEKICEVRDKLNLSIKEEEDYSVIYELSVKLDKLIADFYKINK
jgi:hypothetical protein